MNIFFIFFRGDHKMTIILPYARQHTIITTATLVENDGSNCRPLTITSSTIVGKSITIITNYDATCVKVEKKKKQKITEIMKTNTHWFTFQFSPPFLLRSLCEHFYILNLR